MVLTLATASQAAQLPANAGGFTKTLRVSGAVDLRIRADTGEIRIHAGPANQVSVTAVLSIQRQSMTSRDRALANVRAIEANPPVEQAGNLITIGRFADPKIERGIIINYDVTVPPDTRVESATDTGSHTIDGITGPVKASSDTGRLTISNIGADVRATTDTGRIEVNRIGGFLIATADTGGVKALEIAGSIDITVDSGSVEAEQTKPSKIRIATDTGQIRVKVPAGAGYDLTARTDTGRIRVEPPLTLRGSVKANDVSGKIGSGGPAMDLRTDTGGIVVSN